MVVVKKRLTYEDRFAEKLSPDWRRVFLHPLVKAITLWTPQETSAEYVASMVSKAQATRNYDGMSLEDKIFLFLLCSVMWRSLGISLLTDPQYNQLGRHIYSGRNLEKVEGNGTSIHYRQTVLWDIPALHKAYRKQGIMPLPEAVANVPVKKKKRLQKHRT